MKILLVTSDFPPDIGGIAAHVYELAKRLADNGHDVSVASVWQNEPLSNDLSKPSLNKFKLFRVKGVCQFGPFKIKMHRQKLKQLVKKLLRKNRFDVVHIHGHAWEAFATKSVPKDIPVVGTMHAALFIKKSATERGRKILAKSLNHLKRIIAPSTELASLVTQLNVPAGRGIFIPNGVDTKKFKKKMPTEQKMRQWQFSKDKKIILCARRIVPKNGIIYFVQAIPILIKTHKNICCVFAGSENTQYADEIRQFIHQKHIESYCLFLGPVPNHEMPILMSAADISVLPSLMEATSITGLESMAIGLPIVGTNVGGIPELIQDKKQGLIVPKRDANALSKAIASLLDNPSLANRLGEAAKKRVQEEFDWSVITKRIEEVYQKT